MTIVGYADNLFFDQIGEMRCSGSKMLFIMKVGCEKYTCTAHNKGFGVMVAIDPVLGICNTIEHWVNYLSLAREK